MLNEINSYCISTNGTQGLEDYQPYIDKIYEFSYNEKYVSDNIKQFIKVQAVFKGLREAANNMDKGDIVLRIMEDAVKVGNNIDFDGGYNYKDRVKERIMYLEKGIRTEKQVPISMIDIDNITNGGLGSGELGVMIGKTGDGKSIFLCNVAVGACMIGKKVAYFTMEANEDILAGRIDGKISGYTVEEMKAKMDKLEAAVMQLPGDLVIKEFPGDITTAVDISNYVNDMIINGFIPDLIVIDYIGILAPTKRSKETRHNIGRVCKDMITHVGKRYKVPVWSAHQSSEVEDDNNINKTEHQAKKENLNKVIGIGGIAEAKVALSAEATLLMSLNQNSIERSQTPQGLRIYVMKNRVGPRPIHPFRMTIDKTRFIIKEAGVINTPAYQ
jgi:replicative DNA helicase